MATTFESGSAVLSGYYFNPASWHVQPVAHDGERLPSGRGGWVRIPTAAALFLVPVLGALFVVFLPVIGFIVILNALSTPVVRVFRGSATELAATLSTGWQPGEAHFTGKRTETRAVESGPAAREDALALLAAEIEDRRRSR